MTATATQTPPILANCLCHSEMKIDKSITFYSDRGSWLVIKEFEAEEVCDYFFGLVRNNTD